MLKFFALGLMALFLSACNLTSQQESSPIPATDNPTQTSDPIHTEVTSTALPESPTLTLVIRESPTSAFNAINAATSTALPIGVRPPTQQINTPAQPVLTATLSQTISPAVTESDIPFPETFNDQHEIQAGQGRTIYVNYEVVVNNPGTGRVFIEVRDPEGEAIGQLILSETTSDEFEVTTSTSGAHQLLVTSQNLRGFYSVSYGTR